MGRQFEDVDCSGGAPMGRTAWHEKPTAAHTVRLFRVRLDAGGYDDGGAYWGIGAPLWCATDGGDYREFTRAQSRLCAVVALGLNYRTLKRPPLSEFLRLRGLEARGVINAGGVILRQKLEALGFSA